MFPEERVNHTTGLCTWPVFELLFSHEVARMRRYPSPIVLLRIGLRLPHATDDGVAESSILAIAQVLNSRLRQVDVPAHCEEGFIVMLPATDEIGGLVVGHRLMQCLTGPQHTRTNQAFYLSVYMGLTAHEGGPSANEATLLSEVEQAVLVAQQRHATALINYRDLEV